MSDVKETSPRHSLSFWSLLLKYVVPLAVSVGLCWLLFAKVDFGEMMEIIRSQCRFGWIALALALSVLSHVIRAMRWRIQLRALGISIPLFPVVLSIFGTYAVNLVFPRLGELWRTGYIAKRQGVAFDRVFGSMIADRLADTITVALLTLATFVFAGHALMQYLSQNAELYGRITSLLASPVVWTAVVAVIAAVAGFFFVFRRNRLVVRFIDFCVGIWRGFAVITSMPGKGWWLLLTVALWTCYFVQLLVCFFAFPATAEVVSTCGVQAPFVCWVFSSLAMGVPSNGGIGPWQWAVVFGLSLYAFAVPAITTPFSTAFANLVLGTNTLLLIALGLFTFVCIAIDRRGAKKLNVNRR